MTRRILIMGAAGRDFHDFNVVFRDDPDSRVVAFTATQIPFIDERTYPAELAGPLRDALPVLEQPCDRRRAAEPGQVDDAGQEAAHG